MAPPWGIYPLQPAECAGLIADILLFTVPMSSNNFIEELHKAGMNAEWVLAEGADMAPLQPIVAIYGHGAFSTGLNLALPRPRSARPLQAFSSGTPFSARSRHALRNAAPRTGHAARSAYGGHDRAHLQQEPDADPELLVAGGLVEHPRHVDQRNGDGDLDLVREAVEVDVVLGEYEIHDAAGGFPDEL